ncbi:MAG TPA: hypothetical protein PK710_15035, partial [Polyangiaceae bacterium]|nr:hypothetical protein [Polyangiaceae bacterium]
PIPSQSGMYDHRQRRFDLSLANPISCISSMTAARHEIMTTGPDAIVWDRCARVTTSLIDVCAA